MRHLLSAADLSRDDAILIQFPHGKRGLGTFADSDKRLAVARECNDLDALVAFVGQGRNGLVGGCVPHNDSGSCDSMFGRARRAGASKQV